MKRIVLLQLASLPVLLASITLFSDRTYAQAPQKASPQEQTVAWTKTLLLKMTRRPGSSNMYGVTMYRHRGPAPPAQLEQFEKLFGKEVLTAPGTKAGGLVTKK